MKDTVILIGEKEKQTNKQKAQPAKPPKTNKQNPLLNEEV